MMGKKGKICLVVFLLLAVVFLIYKVFTFQLFDSKMELLEKLPVNQSNYSVLLYRFPSSATVVGSIQVHLIQNNTGNSKFYENYDRFNKIVFAEVLNDNVLFLGLQDTVSYKSNIDTIRLKLPNQY